MKLKTLRKFLLSGVIASLVLASFSFAQQQQQRDFSKETARISREWVKDAVIYEIFPRAFSQKGDFNSITSDLDRLKDLGVTVLWLMPIHPIGREKAKGTIGSPYAVRDFYAINPDYGTKEDLQASDRGIAQTRNESDHRHRRQSHGLGQRFDARQIFLHAERERRNRAARA